MPDVEFITIKIQKELKSNGRHIGYGANTAKLTAQNKYIQAVDDDVILIDADMMCTGDAKEAFSHRFDVAYTMRTKTRPGCPNLNGGVLMIRNNEEAKEWFQLLEVVNHQMYINEEFHNRWVKQYPGMNQSALGYMLEESWLKTTLHEYKTLKWNAVDCDWADIGDDTVFVHCKGKLREAIKNNTGPGYLAKLVNLWYSFCDETENSSRDDGQKREYLVQESSPVCKKIRRPYTHYRHRQRRRHP